MSLSTLEFAHFEVVHTSLTTDPSYQENLDGHLVKEGDRRDFWIHCSCTYLFYMELSSEKR